MPKRSSHPHVSWRDGRPRFQPDQALRAAGHKGKDLRHDDGRWFSRGEAVDWSDAFVRQLASAKKKPAARATPAPRPQLYTLGRLFEEWFRAPKFQMPADPHEERRLRAAKIIYSRKTVRDFRQKARIVETHDPSLWASPVDALSQPVLLGLYEELVKERGLASARGAIAVMSIALAWGRRRGKFTFKHNQGVNPARDLGMATPPERMRFGSRAEISALIGAADAMPCSEGGWPEMGDMIALGVWTGQRQEDRLLLVDKGLFNGRRIFRQAKTGAIVAVREAPELEARLRAAAERRRRAGVVHPRVILDELALHNPASRNSPTAWQPFPDDGDRYRKRFAVLRSFAAAGIVDLERTDALRRQWQAEGRNSRPPIAWKVAPCPSLLGGDGVVPFVEADLRSTAVTWMALAGATIPEIIAVTGHTLASATNILKHYLVLHPDMADSAIGKMVAWYEADGETEIGL